MWVQLQHPTTTSFIILPKFAPMIYSSHYVSNQMTLLQNPTAMQLELVIVEAHFYSGPFLSRLQSPFYSKLATTGNFLLAWRDRGSTMVPLAKINSVSPLAPFPITAPPVHCITVTARLAGYNVNFVTLHHKPSATRLCMIVRSNPCNSSWWCCLEC